MFKNKLDLILDYHDLMKSSLDMIYVIDLKGNFLEANEIALDIFGYNREEISEVSFENLISREQFTKTTNAIKEIVKFGRNSNYLQYKIKTKDGRFIFIETYGIPLRRNGKIYAILGVANNITKRELIEKKLIKSEEEYKLISENANDLIAVVDDNFDYIYINEQGHKKLMGYSKEDLIGQSSLSFIHPDDFKEAIKILKKGFKIGEGSGEVRIRNSRGTYNWLEIRGKTYIDNKGNKKGLFISRDVSSRKKTEEKLRESEEKYRLISENANDLIRVLDKKFKINYINEATHFRLLGYNNQDLIGKSAKLIQHPDEKEKINQFLREVLIKGEGRREGRIKHKDGYWIWFDILTKVLKDSSGELKGLVISRDITEKKKIEELKQKEIETLKELDQVKREIITRTSHELKTPLTSIYGACQLLYEGYKNDLPEKALELVELSLQGGKRIQKLISNMLDVSALESGEITLSKQRENLIDLFKECIKEISYLTTKSNVKIFFDAPDKIYLDIDKFQIETVIINLLNNAVKNNSPGGKVFCKLRIDLNSIEISIKDTGVGITEEEMHKIFKKFGKIERYGKGMNIDMEGSGLGLYISKQIVELHNGKIWAESEGLNKGTTFFIKLPSK